MNVCAEAERALLGSVIVDNRLLWTLEVKPSHMGIPAHGVVLDAILALARRGPVDLVNLTQHLADTGRLEDAGGAEAVSSLTDGATPLTTVRHYEEVIREQWIRRRIRRAGAEIAAMADSAMSAEDAVAKASALAIALGAERRGHTHSGDELVTMEVTDQPERKNPEHSRLRWGFAPLDDKAGPWVERGSMWVVGARPGIGKTSFLLQVADHNACRGLRVLHFALEMGAMRNLWRMAAQRTGVPLRDIKTLDMGEGASDAYAEFLGHMSGLSNFALNDDPLMDSAGILSSIRRQKGIWGDVDLVLVDYFQLIKARKDRDNWVHERTEVCRELKWIAESEKVAVVVGWQLNRDAHSDCQQERPKLRDLKHTGGAEEQATGVILLHQWGRLTSEPGAEVLVAKQQDGWVGILPAYYRPEVTRWEM